MLATIQRQQDIIGRPIIADVSAPLDMVLSDVPYQMLWLSDVPYEMGELSDLALRQRNIIGRT
jgi:hypothetical protein